MIKPLLTKFKRSISDREKFAFNERSMLSIACTEVLDKKSNDTPRYHAMLSLLRHDDDHSTPQVLQSVHLFVPRNGENVLRAGVLGKLKPETEKDAVRAACIAGEAKNLLGAWNHGMGCAKHTSSLELETGDDITQSYSFNCRFGAARVLKAMGLEVQTDFFKSHAGLEAPDVIEYPPYDWSQPPEAFSRTKAENRVLCQTLSH